MSNYTKTTDFEAKDSLPTGDSGKIIRGAEFETEFDAISTAIATKADTAGPTFTGTLTFETISDGTIGVTAFVDEDDMSSDSATLVPTQQSVKAYVDSQVTAQDLDFQADSGGALSIDLDSETLTFTGGTGIDTSGLGNAVTFAIDSTVATLTGTQTLTNKTLTSPDVNTPDIDGGTIDGTVIGGTTPAAVSATTVSATGNITVGGTVDGRDVATDGTKLDGIESGATADQTAAEIRTLVESATDSNVFTDADHTKLDGIEANATGDQTNAEIRAAVEAATDSNVFTDADHSKLDGIEAGADVTDTANVTAAGALMDSELTSEASVKALNQGVATTDSPTFAAVTVNGNVEFDGLSGTGAVTVTDILDQDDMSSNSATALATQQSIKAYVDSQVATADTLSEVLANGNTTGGTDIAVGTGDDITFADSSKAIFGAGSDLQIYHDGNNSYISDQGTGNLRIAGTLLQLNDASFNKYLQGSGDAVTLYNADSPKLATTSTGIDVTGSVVADSYDIGALGTLGSVATDRLFIATADGLGLQFDFDNSRIVPVGADGSTYNNNVSLGASGLEFKNLFLSGNATFGDNDKAIFGAGSDLSVYSDGTDGLITSTGHLTLDVTGIIKLDADNAGTVYFQDAGTIYGVVEKSSSNMVIRSGESDGDILFKGNDGGSTVTALTLDMSAAGIATFNSGINIGNRGSASDPTLQSSIDPDTGVFWGGSDILGFASGGAEKLRVSSEVVVNDPSNDVDFRVESNGNTHALFVDAGNDHVNIGTSTDLGGLLNVGGSIFAKTTSAGTAVKIESSEAGASAGPGLVLYRSSASPADSDSTGNITFEAKNDAAQDVGYANINSLIEDASDGTEDGMLIFKTMVGGTARSRIAMTTGSGTVFNEDSVDMDFRVESDNNFTALFVDAGNDRIGLFEDAPSAPLHLTTTSAGTAFLIESSDAGSNGGPLITLDRASSSPANGDTLGMITFNGRNDAGEHHNYARIESRIVDVANATEDGRLELSTSVGTIEGTSRLLLNGTETVVNDNSADLDFRVESDNQSHMLFVDSGENNIGVRNASPLDPLHILIDEDNNANRLTGGNSADLAGGLKVENDNTAVDSFAGMFLRSNTYDVKLVASTGSASNEGEFMLLTDTSGGDMALSLYIDQGETVFNEDSRDQDFRVESNNLSSALFVDGANGNVTLQGATTTIGSNAASTNVEFNLNGVASKAQRIQFQESGTNRWLLGQGAASETSAFELYNAGGVIALSVDRTSNIATFQRGAVFNEGSADSDFRVESNINSHALFLEADQGNLLLNTADNTQTLGGDNHTSLKWTNGGSGGRYQLLVQTNAGNGCLTVNQTFADNASRQSIEIARRGTVVGSISTTGTATAYNTSSDARLKENITDADDAGELIDAIQVRSFDWKADGSHQKYGMVAQELLSIAPDAVAQGDSEEDMMGVDYSKLVPMLVKEIQSLRARVAQLESN